MATRNNPQDTQDLENARQQTGLIDEQATSLSNILSLKMQANKAAKEELDIRGKINKLSREEVRKAVEYKDTTTTIKQIEIDLQHAKEQGNRRGIAMATRDLAAEKAKQESLKKTAGGALMALSLEARNKKIALPKHHSF